MSLRLPAGWVGEAATEVRRSRFLAALARTDTEEQARAFVADRRRTHPDARHHCTAFVLAGDGAQPRERTSDDGEPSGTAGQPMLDVLRGADLVDVTAVVTRWFGGVKLGTGGLVRAYSDAVVAALVEAPRVRVETFGAWRLVAPYDAAGRWQADLLGFGAQVTPTYEADHVALRLVHPDGGALGSYVAALTQGDGVLVPDGAVRVEVPVRAVT